MILRYLYIFAFCALSLTIVGACSSVQAQDVTKSEDKDDGKVIWNYDNKYNPDAMKKAKGKDALLPNSSFSINFVRLPGLKPGEVALRFTQPLATNGCIKDIQMPEPTIFAAGPNMWITVGLPVIELDKSVRYAHYGCRQGQNIVQADAIINRDKLINNRVKYITLKNAFGIDKYNVDVGQYKIALTPQTSVLFKQNEHIKNKDPLEYVFYPENALIVYVPLSDDRIYDQKDLMKEVKRLTIFQGLRPLKSVVKDFTNPNDDPSLFYYIDPSGEISGSIQGDELLMLGHIIVGETFYGPNGTYEKPRQLDVFARRPGLLD